MIPYEELCQALNRSPNRQSIQPPVVRRPESIRHPAEDETDGETRLNLSADPEFAPEPTSMLDDLHPNSEYEDGAVHQADADREITPAKPQFTGTPDFGHYEDND